MKWRDMLAQGEALGILRHPEKKPCKGEIPPENHYMNSKILRQKRLALLLDKHIKRMIADKHQCFR